MRQRIAHGATIDTATPDEVAALIAGAFDRRDDYDFKREPGTVNLDANGNGTKTLHLTRQYAWLCERVALTTQPAAAALIALYHNQVQGSDLAEVVQLGAAGMYSDSFSNRLYVPAGSQLVIAVTGGAANGQATFSIQIRLIKVAE